MNTMRFEKSRCRVEVHLLGEVIAYARDEPNLVWINGMFRKQGRSTYEYFICGSPLVTAMGWQQCQMKFGFASLKQAVSALRRQIDSQY